MITVGINNNVYLASAKMAESKDGKSKNLALTWGMVGEGDAPPSDGFSDLMGGEVIDSESGRATTIFGAKNTTYDGKPLKAEAISEDIAAVKNQLLSVLGAYRSLTAAPDGSIPGFSFGSDIYAGTGIVDGATFNKGILQQPILDRIYENMCSKFIAAITPFLNRQDLPMRLLLIRQSKTKNFCTLRRKRLKSEPFLEPMSIPEQASKLKFSEYEIKNGLDNDTPIAAAEHADRIPGSDTAGSSVPDNVPFPDNLDTPNAAFSNRM